MSLGVTERECVALLQWALPRLEHRWEGYRRMHRQVCRRIAARIRTLGLPDAAAYRLRLEVEPAEWTNLRRSLPVTISRFFRDRSIFRALTQEILPALADAARGGHAVSAWSAGCAGGEEPYSLSLIWAFELRARHPALGFSVLATDVDSAMLRRAEAACYAASSLKDLPPGWLDRAFLRDKDRYCLLPALRHPVHLLQQDICTAMPDGPFHLILCRNLAFTYFAEELQRRIAQALLDRLAPGGCLVLGAHERLPERIDQVEPWPGQRCLFRKR
jgi:chemotaxis protein methyltransferase CheR